MLARAFWVWLHRWAGLAMAGFLILVGLTGSLLAFWPELNHWLTPELYPGPQAGVELDAATLARRAEAIVPQARVSTIHLAYHGTAMIGLEAREGAPTLDFEFLHLDPIDGHERGRVTWHDLPRRKSDIMPFIYGLHMYLAMKGVGDWILGAVALVWTIDCFVGFYLTLPEPSVRARKGFLSRWKSAWLVKTSGSFYRVNFDLHRASGLWLWAMLFVFAWSGVFFLMPSVYSGVMQSLFSYTGPEARAPSKAGDTRPSMEWEQALATGERLMQAQATEKSFTIDRPIALNRLDKYSLYEYRVHSSRDVGEKAGYTSVFFDSRTGEARGVKLPTGERAGDTITTWLVELHTANVFGLAFRVFVCIFGLVVAILSGTGVYIWWRKRCARINRRVPAGGSPARVSRSGRSVVSVAWLSATAAAKRTQQSRGVRD